MAATDQPSGLMDIASTLTQDEIPYKLRCAICNKLAVNAFRLPCCEQAICENCQTSLPETCPVCAHNPITPDLCKPNKALRTTLKAFLRTEEKKRERERPSAAPATPVPIEEAPTHQQQETPAAVETPDEDVAKEKTSDAKVIPGADTGKVDSTSEATKLETEAPVSSATAENVAEADPSVSAESQVRAAEEDSSVNNTVEGAELVEQNVPAEGGEPVDVNDQSNAVQEGMEQRLPVPNPMGLGFGGNAGGFPNMPWSSAENFSNNPMGRFMANGMFNNLQNPTMGLPAMTMDPMTAGQGIFGGYGMSMNGMNSDMNMGMSFDAGQGMYGGWDGSQNNMWNGGQDKFNPNAFANGMGPSQYGGGPSGFGGYNMSHHHQPNGNYAPSPAMQQHLLHFPPNPDFSNGFHGPGYGRGGFRGRGRGFAPSFRGRPGYPGYMQANYPPNANFPASQIPNSPMVNQAEMPSQSPDAGVEGGGVSTTVSPTTNAAPLADRKKSHDESSPGDARDLSEDPSRTVIESTETAQDDMPIPSETRPVIVPTDKEAPAEEDTQLHGIPTIDSIDEANAAQATYNGPPSGMSGHINNNTMGPSFPRGGGYMRGPFPGGRGGGFPNRLFMPGPYQPTPSPSYIPSEVPGQGVQGAPAAPRAMRQGLPNTSVLRQRGGASVPVRTPSVSVREAENLQSETPGSPQGERRTRLASRSRSRTRSRSPSHSRHETRRHHRYPSQSVDGSEDERERRRDRQKRRSRRDVKGDELTQTDEEYGSRSPSHDSLKRVSHRRDRDRERDREREKEKEKERRSTRRSHRSHRHRSRTRSRSPSRNGESRRLGPRSVGFEEDDGADSGSKAFALEEGSEVTDRVSASANHRSSRKERISRREDRESRRKNRGRDRDREQDRAREKERDREKRKDRDHRDRRERDRERERERERGRKRSRRDRSASPVSDHFSHRHSRRAKRAAREDDIRNGDQDKPKMISESKPEKDPHTSEREARNRERLLREKQRRQAMHADVDGNGNGNGNGNGTGKSSSSRRHGNRQDHRATLSGGRRMSYKYEDDASEAWVEKEREASRWA